MNWMLYGAYGYTGQLIVEEALKRGHRPLLAGRSAHKLQPLAERLGLEWRAMGLDDAAALTQAVQGNTVVLHAAGPFVETSRPMLEACLAAKAHYLDITGEIPVFQHTFSLHERAQQQGVALISGVGFDVVPTDCLALHVANRALGATHLEIAIAALGRASSGTTQSGVEMLAIGNLARQGGELVGVPLGYGVRKVHFTDRERTVMAIPWGDLATAYRSTGIPNITTFAAYPSHQIASLRRFGPVLQPIFKVGIARKLVRSVIKRTVEGPDEHMRHTLKAHAWARAYNPGATGPEGKGAEAWLETPEAYHFTALAAVRSVEKLLAPEWQGKAGAFTPAQAFGEDFVLEIEGTQRRSIL